MVGQHRRLRGVHWHRWWFGPKWQPWWMDGVVEDIASARHTLLADLLRDAHLYVDVHGFATEGSLANARTDHR